LDVWDIRIIIFRKRRHLFLLVDFTTAELIIPRV
jgi:hypothetical protein